MRLRHCVSEQVNQGKPGAAFDQNLESCETVSETESKEKRAPVGVFQWHFPSKPQNRVYVEWRSLPLLPLFGLRPTLDLDNSVGKSGH